MERIVSLAEVRHSGAYAWTAKERAAYANDRALIAVSAATNRSKTDQDPSTWLLPGIGCRCQYVTDWIADSWIGTGSNTPVTAEQITAVVGEEAIPRRRSRRG
ncbi:hypothetical protein AB0E10_44400 [Streptomyces sp. NPDC048045]|uniref:hypothetical protein n=1 Tax=Streptomyces sp. NPDC048045 TaxID=3154710 RepID=UPI003444E9F7